MKFPIGKKHSLIAVSFTAFISFMVFAIEASAGGIISDFTSHTLIPFFLTSIQVTPFTWFIIIVLCLALVAAVAKWWYTRKEVAETIKNNAEELNGVTEIYEKLLKMDDYLFRMIPSLIKARAVSPQELENVARKLIEGLLVHATSIFSKDVQRGALFTVSTASTVDAQNGVTTTTESLKIWTHLNMTEDSIKRTVFDLSAHATHPFGIARETYRTEKIIIVHINKQGRQWQPDDDNYRDFRTQPVSGHPSPLYSSFACVPIMDPSLSTTPLAVVCLDSQDKTAFDQPDTEHLLEQIGQRIAKALIVYDELRKIK